MSADYVQRFISPIDSNRVLHAIVDTSQIESGRVNVSPESEWLQMSIIALAEGASMAPHVHKVRPALDPAKVRLTQEAWLVLKGSLRVRLYDEERNFLAETTMGANQLLMTFYGGHSFSDVARGTVILECKNGPYEGRDYTAFEEKS